MAFFDLNIPYTESPKRNSTSDKSLRLKLAVKAMELGYTAVAYNRTITGVMSESDRCSISLFPLSSVVKLSPSISAAVNLHRRVLNVPTTAPFRQYTRLTVVVESPAQGSCLNSGNPVLKTYDVVAVRPLKQESFDQACKNYEVDIISIDFSENRFRLKQPMVKAAVERGVCFEITYSGLLVDAQLRRQMIANAKLLVDWTRGKNVIFSSAAASLTELRGPYDVANLACLLGFSMERAKASVSKTCRSLLENSLRKKKFVKEAIRVELISSTEDSFDAWLKWDPISSGEGDLQLDDMAKSFAASNKESKTVKAIDFVSVINELPSHGLQIIDMVTENKLDYKSHDPDVKDQLLESGNCDITSAIGNLETSASVEASETCAMIIEEPEQQNRPSKVQEDVHETGENLETLASVEGETCAMIIGEPEQQNLSLKVHEDLHENVIDEKESENICSDVPNPGILISLNDKPSSNLQCEEANNFSPDASISQPMTASYQTDRILPSADACLPEEVLEEHTSDTKDVAATPVNSCLASNGVSLSEDIQEEHMSVTGEDVSTAPSCAIATLRSQDELHINGCRSVVCEPMEDVSMELNVEVKDDSHMNQLPAQESSSGRVRRRHRSSPRSVSFPFKRLLKPSHFNIKKALKIKRKSTVL